VRLARALPLLLLVAVGGLLAWLALGRPGAESLDAALGPDHDTANEGDDRLAGHGVALTGERGRVRPKGEAPTEGAPDASKPPTFPPSEGVSGVVLDGRRQPVAKAKVTLHPFPQNAWWTGPDEAAVAETESAKDGTFLVGPAPEVRLKVKATAPGFAPSAVIVPRRGGRIEVVLDVGGGLRVKVVDAKGQPVAGASVQHIAPGWGAPLTSEALSDAQGLATFDAVPAGSGQVVVAKEGLGLVRQPDVGIAPRSMLDVTVVLQAGRSLAGQVVNVEDQRPVVGATLEVHYPWVQGVKPSAPATTDDEGRYKLPIEVPVGEQFELRARHPSFAEARLWLNFNDSGTGQMKHDLKLGQGAQGVNGRVLARDGSGVSGVTVTYGGAQPGQVLPRATTDGEGRFELPAPVWGAPGASMWLIASHPTEGVGHAHATLPKREEARSKPVEMRLAGSGTLAGVVKDDGGTPVSGAMMTLQPDWNAMQRAAGTGRRNFDWQLMNLLQDPNVSGRLTTVTDAQGRYEVAGVPSAWYQVAAAWGGLSATYESAVEVKGGETARADLVLGEGTTIEGIVLDGEDRPIAGANVWAQPTQQRPGQATTWKGAQAQSDGRFALRGVSLGQHQVTAQAANHGQETLRNVEAGTRDVTIKLKSMGWIEGQVLEGSQPYAGTFSVTVRRVGARAGRGRVNEEEGYDSGNAQSFNSPEGVFARRGLPGGEYHVTASTSEGLVMLEPVSVTVVEGRGAGPVRLVLDRGASIVGEIESAGAGPMRGAWLWAQPVRGEGTGPNASARVEDQGQFVLRGLGRGTYRVQITTDAGSTWSEQVEVNPGAERRVRFVERLPGRMRITVEDGEGRKLAKARPQLTDPSGNEVHANWQLLRRDNLLDHRAPDAWERATTTDDSGQLVRHHLPPGRYLVTALLAGHEPAQEATWVEVASSAITDVTVVMKAAK
jgi:hypothetical protein